MKLQKLLALLALAAAPFAFAEGKAEKKADKCDGDKKCDHCDKGAGLTDAEKVKMRAALGLAKKDPVVIAALAKADADKAAAKAARDKAKESKADADKEAAKAAAKTAIESGKAAVEAVHAGMIKADPSVAELLKKCGQGKKHAECDGDCDKGGKGKGKGKDKGDK